MNLISETYRQQNETLHKTKPNFGITARHYAGPVQSFIETFRPETVIDYGCGKAILSKCLLDVEVINYDPGIPEHSELPEPADMLVSIDVMEHIEPECLDAVLKHMASLMKEIGFITIATVLAKKHLPDGRNAHLIVEDYRWWLPKIMEFFEVRHFSLRDRGIQFLVSPLGSDTINL